MREMIAYWQREAARTPLSRSNNVGKLFCLQFFVWRPAVPLSCFNLGPALADEHASDVNKEDGSKSPVGLLTVLMTAGAHCCGVRFHLLLIDFLHLLK